MFFCNDSQVPIPIHVSNSFHRCRRPVCDQLWHQWKIEWSIPPLSSRPAAVGYSDSLIVCFKRPGCWIHDFWTSPTTKCLFSLQYVGCSALSLAASSVTNPWQYFQVSRLCMEVLWMLLLLMLLRRFVTGTHNNTINKCWYVILQHIVTT